MKRDKNSKMFQKKISKGKYDMKLKLRYLFLNYNFTSFLRKSFYSSYVHAQLLFELEMKMQGDLRNCL